MSRAPTLRLRAPGAAPALAVLAAMLALVVGACGSSFDPSGPCHGDGAAPGAYPDLEAAIPKTFRGAPPKELDSGRTCSDGALSTLAGHGVGELRFAGGTWETGTQSGLSLAVFVNMSGPALERDWLAEFYETGARGGKNVKSVDTSDYPIQGQVIARRIDVLNGESYQTIVLWPRNGQIAVALVADFIREIQTREAHDKVVSEAVDGFAG
jgi:hypothetical protein